jgi:uncharacterized Zn finger protein
MSRRRSSYSDYYPYFEPNRPIETTEGIKSRSQRGDFVKNWWAARWIQAMERLVDSGRLTRGRSYARKGQVLSIEETKTGIEARVQGSRSKPYKVTIQVAPLEDVQWEQVIHVLAEKALFAAQLLAGEMPQDIEKAFAAAGVSLFPERRGDLTTHCSCPDYANPCKHVAATHYILGERFDEDPFLLFRLRKRTQEQILQELRRRRTGYEDISGEESEEAPENVLSLEDLLIEDNGATRFWELGRPLDGFSVAIRPPVVEMPLLKRLGNASFIPKPGLDDLLTRSFGSISRTALQIAFEEEQGDPSGPDPNS